MTEPWIYQQLSDKRHVDVPASTPGQDPATTMLPAHTVRYGDVVDWAGPAGYIYTDPVDDDAWPRITEPDDDDLPDAFPPTWSGAPTERDQAAIDAGNA